VGQGANAENYSGNTRTGQKVKPVFMEIRWKADLNTNSNERVRIIIVRALTDATPTIPDILDVGIGQPYVWAPYNRLTLGKKFTILKDKFFDMDSKRATVKCGRMKFRNPGVIKYNGNTASSYDSGGLWIMFMGTYLAATYPTFYGVAYTTMVEI